MFLLIPSLREKLNALQDSLNQAVDPLDHPEVRRMSLRELADLPFPRPELEPAESEQLDCAA